MIILVLLLVPYKDKLDSSFKSLGKYMFKVLDGQDSRKPEYVSN